MNTGWKTWDRILYKFKDKQINIIEIGVYEGIATSWFLTNLMSNKKSKIIAIDTFEGSPVYNKNIDFNIIEDTFYKNIKKTKRDKQVTVMKMLSHEALITLLKSNKIMFDIIFIDASHEARDVISDGILAWKLLKNNGILIFDDYLWDKHNQDYFKPKLAIDSFLQIMKPELKLLYSGYQLLVTKIDIKLYDTPKLSKKEYILQLKNVLNKINYNKYEINIIGNNNKIDYKPIITENIKNLKLLKINNDSYYKKYLNYINKKNNLKINDNININYLILINNNNIKKNILLYLNNNLYSNLLYNIEKNYNYGIENVLYEDIMYTKINNNKKSIKILNTSYSSTVINKKININHNNIYIQKYAEKINNKKVKLFDINAHYNNNEVFNNNINIKNSVKYISKRIKTLKDVEYIINNLNNEKMDCLYLSSGFDFNNIRHIQEIYYGKRLLLLVYLALNIQEIGGNLSLLASTYFSKLSHDIIYILQKYYENIKLTYNSTISLISSNTKIYALNFKGISKLELNNLKNIIKIYDKKENIYLTSFINNNNYEDQLYKFNKLRINDLLLNINILERLKEFSKYNKEIFKSYLLNTQIYYSIYWFDSIKLNKFILS